jgi:hypothetical protein
MKIEDQVRARIAAIQSKPITHVVVTTYDDGSTKEHRAHGLSSANNWAVGERRKIGRTLVNRDTLAAVRVMSVEVKEI